MAESKGMPILILLARLLTRPKVCYVSDENACYGHSYFHTYSVHYKLKVASLRVQAERQKDKEQFPSEDRQTEFKIGNSFPQQTDRQIFREGTVSHSKIIQQAGIQKSEKPRAETDQGSSRQGTKSIQTRQTLGTVFHSRFSDIGYL